MIQYRVFRFRWAILLALVPAILSSEVCWLTFAPISSAAMAFYGVSSLSVDLFSVSYMLMYILLTFPASWVIDRWGWRASVMIGGGITAVFALARWAFAGNYTLVLLSQFLLAAGQPFLVNVSTKVPANWFAPRERSTAAGILMMAQYLGFILPMIASPLLVESMGMAGMLGVYGALCVVSAAAALAVGRERPPVPPGPPAPAEPMNARQMLGLLRCGPFLRVLAIGFVSMGIFNTLMTVLEKLLAPQGFSAMDAGLVGAVFVVSGIIGAVVVPMVSDRMGRRAPLMMLGVGAIAPLTLGLGLMHGMAAVVPCAAVLGFLVMGLAPVLFQHGAEVAYPVPEGASFALIMLAGQVSGAAFVWGFNLLMGTGTSTTAGLTFLVLLAAAQLPAVFTMKESGYIAPAAKEEQAKQ